MKLVVYHFGFNRIVGQCSSLARLDEWLAEGGWPAALIMPAVAVDGLDFRSFDLARLAAGAEMLKVVRLTTPRG